MDLPEIEISYGDMTDEQSAKFEEQLKETFKDYKVYVKRHDPEPDPTGYPV